MKPLLTFTITVILFSCSRQDIPVEIPLKDWNVRYEITTNHSGDQGFISYSTGKEIVFVGNSAYTITWPNFPWVRDTVFKAQDGKKQLELNVLKVINPQIINDNAEGVVSKIWVNGKVVAQGNGMNAFVKYHL